MDSLPANVSANVPASAAEPPYAKATDDLRQVFSTTLFGKPHYISRVQRRYVVQDGPVRSALTESPPGVPLDTPLDQRPWITHPTKTLHWIALKSEWRDLPFVTENEVRMEKRASGAVPQITSEPAAATTESTTPVSDPSLSTQS